METYIKDSLTAGLIHPPSSPVGAGFFFVCQELHLITSAFELLQGATVFPKLDLRNASNLIRIKEQTNGRKPSTPPWDILSIW